jgi:hypothetical protein
MQPIAQTPISCAAAKVDSQQGPRPTHDAADIAEDFGHDRAGCLFEVGDEPTTTIEAVAGSSSGPPGPW